MQENVTSYLQTTFCPAFEKSQIVHDKELAYVLPLDAGEGGHEVTLALSYKYDSYELLMGHLEQDAGEALRSLALYFGQNVLTHITVMQSLI